MIAETVKRSRSFRSFDSRVKIDNDTLLGFIDNARIASATMNLQPLKYRIVNTPEEVAATLKLTRWAASLSIKLPPEGHAPTAYIVVCFDNNVVEDAEKFQKDVGICAQTIMLAAAEAGFGGCMISSFSPIELKKGLQLPANISPALVLAFGKSNETVEIVDESSDGSVTYYRENGIHYVQKRTLEHLIVK